MTTTWYSKTQTDVLLAGRDPAGAAAGVQNAVNAALAAKADLVAGVIPTSQLPSISLENAVVVANRAAMLALTATQVQPGDIAVDTSTGSTRGSYILTAADPSLIGNWLLLNAPLDAVQSVNGQSGTVVLSAANVGADAAGAAAAATINLPVNVMSASGTAVIGARNAVNASAGPVAVALPTPTAVGQHMIVERSDVSATAANAVTITGTIRETPGTIVTLAAVGAANEGGHYVSESLTSWAIAGSIKPKAVLDVYYDAKGAGLTNADPSSQQRAADAVSLASPWQQFTTRPQRPPTKVVTRFSGASGWNKPTGVTEDLTTVLFGDRTLKWTLGASGNAWPDSGTFTAQDWSASIIRLWIKVDTPANLQSISVYIDQGTGNTVSASVQANFLANEWVPVTMSRSQFTTAAGTPNWAGVTKVGVPVNSNAGGALNVWLGGVELIPDLAAAYPSGVMVVEMDDGYAGQFTYGLPVLAARGVPVTYNVIGDRFVGAPSATGKYAADLRQLQDAYGWQIACHAYATAAHGSSVNSVATMEADFQRQKQWLHANGLHAGADHYALCPGTGSPVAAGTMMQAIQKSFRSVRVNSGFYETANPGDPLRLRSVLFSGAGNSVANVKANIDKCAGAGGTYIFGMHDIIAGATDGTSNGLPAVAATNLATILDYAASKGMVFRTRADYIDGR